MCTETLKPQSLRRSDSVSGVAITTSHSASIGSYHCDSLGIRLQLNMGDHSHMQRSSSHHTQDDISIEHQLPARTLSPMTVGCTTPDSIATYSSVAPFSYSLAYDSSLPTPVSVAGSPSMSDRQSVKMVHSYSNAGSTSQQLTPPGTARPSTAEWFNSNQSLNMIRTTQSSSPMTINPSTDLLGMHGLDTTHSPPAQGIPVTSGEYHWGSYGVSSTEPQEDMTSSMSTPAFLSHIPNMDPSALLKSYQLPPTTHMPLAPAPQVPILNSTPNPRTLGAPVTPIEALQSQNPFGMRHGRLLVGIQPSYKKSPRNTNGRRGQLKKRQRAGNRQKSSRNSLGDYDDDQEHSRAESTSPTHHVKEERAPREVLKLRPDDKRPEDHYLFNLREELIQCKGRGMWDKIAERYHSRYEKKERAALQMQLSRAVYRLAIWPESEDRALLEALEEYDRRRYVDILKMMKEKGGCRAWDWKTEHIAKRLAELGEEPYDEESKPNKIRKKRKELQIQKEQPNLWNQPSPPSAVYDEQGFSLQTRVNLSLEEEDQLFQNLFVPEPESPEPDTMDISESGPTSRRASNQELDQAYSEHVAKQACEQMIAQQHRDNNSYYTNQYSGQQNYHLMS